MTHTDNRGCRQPDMLSPPPPGRAKRILHGATGFVAILLGLWSAGVVAADRTLVIGERIKVPGLLLCDTEEQARSIIDAHQEDGFLAANIKAREWVKTKNDEGQPSCGVFSGPVTIGPKLYEAELPWLNGVSKTVLAPVGIVTTTGPRIFYAIMPNAELVVGNPV